MERSESEIRALNVAKRDKGSKEKKHELRLGHKKRISLFMKSNYNTSHGMEGHYIMFFSCLGFVLLLCILGRWCIIPAVHACNFEINNRKYIIKMDKNTIC